VGRQRPARRHHPREPGGQPLPIRGTRPPGRRYRQLAQPRQLPRRRRHAGIADAVRIEPIPATAHVPWIGVFRAGSPAGSDPWYFTQHLTRPHVTDATNPGWGAGTLGDQPVTGDWDGDGVDGIGVFRSAGGDTWYFNNDRTSPASSFSAGSWGAGSLGDIAVAGDWDGDGTDGIGVFRTSTSGTNWFLANNAAAPTSDYSFHYGAGALGDLPVVGDWDGDGIDTVGVFRTLSGTWFLNNGFTDTTAYQFAFGALGDIPVAEDWDGDGMDDIGLFRPSTGEWFFDTNFDGIADLYNAGYGSGALGDVPVAGHFVPEPATLALLALGLLPILRRRRR